MVLYWGIYSGGGHTAGGERVKKNSHKFLYYKLSTLLLTIDLFVNNLGKLMYIFDNSLHRDEEFSG